MPSLLLYAFCFFCNGWLAYKIVSPTDRQGLLLFIAFWLLLILLLRSTSTLLSIVQKIYGLFKTGKVESVDFMVVKWLDCRLLYNLTYILVGIALWFIIQPESIWQGYMYLVMWKLIVIGMLPWFVTVNVANPQIK